MIWGCKSPTDPEVGTVSRPGGGKRMLGILTILDRLIQQAMHQVLSPLFDPDFSANSYGFCPGRNALQAVKAARKHVESDLRWVVDIDLEKFFDRAPGHTDVVGKTQSRRPYGAVADRQISQGRDTRRRINDSTVGRHAARLAALSASVQYPPAKWWEQSPVRL